MVVHPPREGFFRRELWNLKWNTGLAVRREMYLVRILVIDADAHHIEIHYCAQLACEKPEEFLRRSDRDEGLRNAEEGFVSLSCRRTGPALVGVAHQYPRVRFDSISQMSQSRGPQNKASQNSGCQQNTPTRTPTSLNSSSSPPPNPSAIRLRKSCRQSGSKRGLARLSARTLDSKIKRFKINKYRFKVQRAS